MSGCAKENKREYEHSCLLFIRSVCSLNRWYANVRVFRPSRLVHRSIRLQVHSPSARYSNSRHTFECAGRRLSTAARPPGRPISHGCNDSIVKVKREMREMLNASGKHGCRFVYDNFMIMEQVNDPWLSTMCNVTEVGKSSSVLKGLLQRYLNVLNN